MFIPDSPKLNSGLRHQTIMIKIEPEHLGPARLDLQLRHDIFSAKLTVETFEAKAVIEHSLHNLKEQLARADIKVEQIEINVRGETGYNQLFDKQPQWQKNSHFNQFRFTNDELNEQFAPIGVAFVPESMQYVNQNGVNVLA
jgi:flagellar hook-length control protein FliK